MQREEKSERSRRLVLDAALKLFSTQGYRATSVREIADAAGVSTGNLYHHFPDKESIFRTLLDEYRTIVTNPKFPMMRAFVAGRFPNNLEQIGFAARDSVRLYRQYMVLHYVDMIEFDGSHIRDFYAGMAQRFAAILDQQRAENDDVASRLRPGVSAISALLVTTRMFLNYFQLELLFGVPEPFGKESAQVVAEIADMLRRGIAPP
jgi:AcrR family transcriptional regulator